jgi:hypothetical protein
MDNEPLDHQITRLADCILTHFPEEPGRGGSEGAVDVAIRLLTRLADFQAAIRGIVAEIPPVRSRP